MKPSVVKVDTYIDWCVPHNKRYSKFRFGAIWEFQNPKIFFAKGYMQNWSDEVFAINKVKNIIPGTLLSVILAMKWNIIWKRIVKDKQKIIQSWKRNQEKR